MDVRDRRDDSDWEEEMKNGIEEEIKNIDWAKEWKKFEDPDYESESESESESEEKEKEAVAVVAHQCPSPVKYISDVVVNTWHQLTTPLIQIFSVSIFADFGDKEESCEIYGLIEAVEGLDNVRFNLYDRTPNEPETVVPRHVTLLPIMGPIDTPILPSMCTTDLVVCLRDKTRDVEVVKGRVCLDPVSEDSYDRLLKRVVKGEHGYVCVYYTVFQFADMGIVEVIATDGYQETDTPIRVCGNVFATYGHTTKYCHDEDDEDEIKTRLFNKPVNRPFHVKNGSPIPLSTVVVAVPAYSSLAIELNLLVSGSKFEVGPLYFSCNSNAGKVLIQHGQRTIQLRVLWKQRHTYHRRYGYKMQRLPGASMFTGRSIRSTTSKPRFGGYRMLEVFTVFIGGINRKISALCGIILITEGTRKLLIYKRDADSFELLQDNSFASIVGPYRAVESTDLFISLNLKDPTRNLEVSQGEFRWNHMHLDGGIMPWYNKRVCSVVRGKHGFAAVHYVFFSSASKALVKIKFFDDGNGDVPVNVYGCLLTGYTNWEFESSYEKKYFRSRLFDRERHRSVELKSGSKIHLSKSLVAVPDTSSLVIEADLRVLAGNGVNSEDETIRGTAEFEGDTYRTVRKIIQGGQYRIQVSVKCISD